MNKNEKKKKVKRNKIRVAVLLAIACLACAVGVVVGVACREDEKPTSSEQTSGSSLQESDEQEEWIKNY